jgi:hypothetical protein
MLICGLKAARRRKTVMATATSAIEMTPVRQTKSDRW